MHRFAAIVLALLVLSMSAPVTSVQAKTCADEILVDLQDDYHVVISSEEPMSHVEFLGMENMRLLLPGKRMEKVADFDWRLPAQTRQTSFSVKHYNLSKDMHVVLIIHDECQQEFVLPLVAWATVVMNPYPYPPYDIPRARTLTPIKAPAQVPHR